MKQHLLEILFLKLFYFILATTTPKTSKYFDFLIVSYNFILHTFQLQQLPQQVVIQNNIDI